MSTLKRFFSFIMLLILAGCSTPEHVNWERQIGKYTYDEARDDLGVPQQSKPEKDGSITAEWVIHRGTPDSISSIPTFSNSPLPDTFHATPSHHLKLTFGPDHKLASWQEFDR